MKAKILESVAEEKVAQEEEDKEDSKEDNSELADYAQTRLTIIEYS